VAIQIYGLLVVDPSWVVLTVHTGATHLNQGQGRGSYLPVIDQNKGQFVFSAPQTLMGCALRLPPTSTHSVLYSCALPDHLPPSFSGTALRYSYFVMIVAQRDTSMEPVLTRFPFTVLNPAAGIYQHKAASVASSGFKPQSTEVRVSEGSFIPLERSYGGEGRAWHPLLESGLDVAASVRESALRTTLDALFEKHGKTVTIIVNKGSHPLVKFSSESSIYKPGDIVKVHFDFSQGLLPCYQVSATLQYTEEINANVLHIHRSNMKRIVHIVDSSSEATHNASNISFTFELPLECQAQFSTELVDVNWSLNFLFITAKKWDDRKGELNVDYSPQDVESLEWNLPIRVLVPFYPNEVDTRCRKKKDSKSVLKF